MRTPIFVRPPTDAERETLEAGLHSSEAFVLRRSQIVLESAEHKLAPEIAEHLHCHADTVRNAIHAFNAQGVAALQEGSSTPHTIHAAFRGQQAERLRTVLHQSPRTFGKPTSLWTLDLAAEVSLEQGVTPARVSGETLRATLARLGVRWQRAKRWITSPEMVMVLSTLLDPKLLIADEITSALDVSTQKAVAEMLVEFRNRGCCKSVIVITHDLSLAHYISERAVILYRGCVVEMGATDKIFDQPLHPYSKMLMASVPRLDKKWQAAEAELKAQPSPRSDGCVYYERCPVAEPGCTQERPMLVDVNSDHCVACCGYKI